MSVAKREDKYEPPGIVTPPGLIKYKKHEVSTHHTTLPLPLPAHIVLHQSSAACKQWLSKITPEVSLRAHMKTRTC